MAPEPDQPVFDEDFVKGAAFTEPSARERQREPRRRRQRRPSRGSWRRRRARRRTEKLLYDSPGPGWRAHGRTKIAAYAFITVLLAVAIGGAIWEQTGLGRDDAPSRVTLDDGGGGGGGAAGGEPSIDPADPFAGTPAAGFANGEAGVRTPDPVATNGLSDKDLALAYHFVRKSIVAANLDPDVVYKGQHTPFTRLLDPEQQRYVIQNLGRKGDRSTRLRMTMLAPGSAEPASPVIKVNGTVRVSPAKRDGRTGVLAKADHVFVYAIQKPGDPGTIMRLVVRRTGEYLIYREGSRVKFWQTSTGMGPAPAECDTQDGYVHPVYGHGGGESQASGRPVDPYDLTKPFEQRAECGRTTPI